MAMEAQIADLRAQLAMAHENNKQGLPQAMVEEDETLRRGEEARVPEDAGVGGDGDDGD